MHPLPSHRKDGFSLIADGPERGKRKGFPQHPSDHPRTDSSKTQEKKKEKAKLQHLLRTHTSSCEKKRTPLPQSCAPPGERKKGTKTHVHRSGLVGKGREQEQWNLSVKKLPGKKKPHTSATRIRKGKEKRGKRWAITGSRSPGVGR